MCSSDLAKAVTQLLEGPDLFGFEEAKQKIQAAPWVMNCMKAWLARRAKAEPYKCVAIFVDNSGFDFVLGILPFAREFLKRGTKVSFKFTFLSCLEISMPWP